MARRRKGKKGRRRTKTHSIGRSVGWGMWAYRAFAPLTDPANQTKVGVEYAASRATGLRLGAATAGGPMLDPQWMWETYKMPLLGTLASKVLPKIPVISTLPKSIPVIGKKLRW